MKATTRRKLEMGERALEFCRSNPEDTPGYTAAVERLEALIARARALAAQQREGLLETRIATERKRELRRELRKGHLDHLKRVALAAEADLPAISRKFILGRPGSYYGFRVAARKMAEEATANREILVKHGLSDAVLAGLARSLDDLEEQMDRSTLGRKSHVGASAELDRLGLEIVQVVNVMDGLNRARFAKGMEPLSAWESMRSVATRRPSAEPEEAAGPEAPVAPEVGEVRPAA